MCGIAGVSDRRLAQGAPPDPRLTRMLSLLRHRGPDGEGVARLPGVQIGMRRLAIVAPNDGDQPVWNESRTIAMVMNGEVYNHRELREALVRRGHGFSGMSDAEVVVHLYEERGLDALGSVLGMYALALWDGRTGDLVLARDPIGQKPLLVRALGDSVVFASDLRALVAAPGDGVRPGLDPDGLDRYLLYRATVGRSTLIRGAERVLPGEAVTVRDGAVVDRRRAVTPSRPRTLAPRPARATPRPSRDALIDELDRTLAAAVARTTETAVPTGMLLSAGVDSSLVLALLGERARGIPAFIADWDEDNGLTREWPRARALAEAVGARPERVAVASGRLAESLPHLAGLLDEPLADPTALPLYATVRAAAPEVRVLLSGEGADELFAGYPGYREPLAAPGLARFAASARGRALETALGRLHLPGAGLLWRARTPVGARYLGPGETFDAASRRALYAPGWPGPSLAGEALARAAAAPYGEDAWLGAMRAIDRTVWLADEALMKLDRITMGHGVEARVPYLEADVVALADRLPQDLLISRGLGKRALRQVAARHLPLEYALAPKRGFGVPITRLMHGPWYEMARDIVLASDASLAGVFEPAALRALFEPCPPRQRPGRARERFALLMLELWLRAVLSPGAQTAAGRACEGAVRVEREAALAR